MADTQLSDFKIKSQIHDYEVCFVDDLDTSLDAELIEGDFIVIDKKIKELYSDSFSKILGKFRYIVIEASEVQKSYEGVIPVLNSLMTEGFKKNHRLVAVGGGITQDVTAFIASILYRGVDWLFYPTSLLAQGDSCIGSKTSINFREFKNQVGGFYPPRKVFIYPEFVNSLPQSEIQSGMGEMLHYFIVSGKEDFDFYKRLYKSAFKNKNDLQKIIQKSLQIKKAYIEKDEFDKHIRQVFNYGHSFGHAIESLTNYSIPHGVAVSFGMDLSNYVSMRMGLIEPHIREEIREVTSYIWNGYSISSLDYEKLIQALGRDKKNVGTQLGLILNKGYGKIFKELVDPREPFNTWIKDYFQEIKAR